MSKTQNLGLTYLTAGQLQPEVTVNNDLNILDAAAGLALQAFSNNPATTSGLTYGYFGGQIYSNGANIPIANGTIALTASVTNYVQRTAAGVVSVNSTGFTAGLIPMAQVVAGGGSITSITDKRPATIDLYGAPPGFKNYLINGDFAINQRVFAGGALAAGVYGFDRWKAGTGGCNISLSAGVLTHTSGPLVQVIEAPNLAGKTITVSVEGLSGGSLNVNVEGVTGVIAASAVRAGVTLAVPSTSTGNVTVTLTPASGSVTYKRVQVELGSVATAFEWRPTGIEYGLCLRYFIAITSTSGNAFVMGAAYTSTLILGFLYLPVEMRAFPAGSATGTLLFDPGPIAATGTATIFVSTAQIIAISMPVSSVTAGTAGYMSSSGPSQTISLDAEL